ncbi:hypothetical protein Tco_0541979, partial [Tanacetum coccineum]
MTATCTPSSPLTPPFPAKPTSPPASPTTFPARITLARQL